MQGKKMACKFVYFVDFVYFCGRFLAHRVMAN